MPEKGKKVRRTKILYLIPQLIIGGTERHLADLVTHLDKQRFEPVVWCTGEWGAIGDEMVETGIKVIKYPLSFYRPGEFLMAAFFIKRGNFDVFHSYGYGSHFIDAVLAKTQGIPTYISSRRNVRHWPRGEKLHLVERVRNYLSDIVIANSEAVKRKSAEVERIAPDKIKVIYNGVDLEEANTKGAGRNLREELDIPDNYIIIGNLANLKPIKGQEYLIQAFAKVMERANRLKLVIIGEGPERERLSALADKLEIGEHVIITSIKSSRFDLVRLFDIFVLSSLTEGFSNVIIEAMAMGKPVIATDVGGNGEAVVHGKTGVLVPPADPEAMASAIIDLASDPELRARFGEAGKKRVEEHFTLRKMVEEYERLYKQLIHQKRGDVPKD